MLDQAKKYIERQGSQVASSLPARTLRRLTKLKSIVRRLKNAHAERMRYMKRLEETEERIEKLNGKIKGELSDGTD